MQRKPDGNVAILYRGHNWAIIKLALPGLGVRFLHGGFMYGLHSLHTVFNFLNSLCLLLVYLPKVNPELVHTVGCMLCCAFLTSLYCEKEGGNVAWVESGSESECRILLPYI